MQLTGVVLLLFGFGVRYWALQHLARAGVTELDLHWAAPQRSYAEGGPYRVLRNPMYWGTIFMLAGAGMAALGGPGVVLFLPAVPYLANRGRMERQIREELDRGVRLCP